MKIPSKYCDSSVQKSLKELTQALAKLDVIDRELGKIRIEVRRELRALIANNAFKYDQPVYEHEVLSILADLRKIPELSMSAIARVIRVHRRKMYHIIEDPNKATPEQVEALKKFLAAQKKARKKSPR